MGAPMGACVSNKVRQQSVVKGGRDFDTAGSKRVPARFGSGGAGTGRPSHSGAANGVASREATAPGMAPPSLPTVSLPTGGGAIRGIDEKLAVNLATGTAGLTIPIATTESRHGFGA